MGLGSSWDLGQRLPVMMERVQTMKELPHQACFVEGCQRPFPNALPATCPGHP